MTIGFQLPTFSVARPQQKAEALSTGKRKTATPQDPALMGKGQPLPRSNSDSALFRHSRSTPTDTSPFRPVQPLLATLMPDTDPSAEAPDTILEELSDSRRLGIALRQYQAACDASPDIVGLAGQAAETLFVEATPDFSVPYHRAVCHLFAAASAQLGQQSTRIVDQHVELALDQLSAHTDFITTSLQNIERKGWSTEEMQATEEAVNMLNHGVLTLLKVSQTLHTDPRYIERKSADLSQQIRQVTLAAAEVHQALNRKQQTEAEESGCTVM